MPVSYWTAVYEPMTVEHYANGGYYRAVTEALDGDIIRYEVGASLSLEEAIAYRGTFRIYFAPPTSCPDDSSSPRTIERNST